jgi:thiosulfate reductase cytochrome b subunit
MIGTANDSTQSNGKVLIHPLVVRIAHWINAFAMLVMIFSGWRIYNAAPLFDFRIPSDVTLGGWLGGALQWHFAAMWLVVLNGIGYIIYGVIAGHFKASFLPLKPGLVWTEFKNALRGQISHEVGVYNAVQRAAYAGVIALIVALVFSGLAIWKPVQFQELAALLGGYEGARLVHFAAMSLVVVFVIVHVVMVVAVPRTFLPMLTGFARRNSGGHGG